MYKRQDNYNITSNKKTQLVMTTYPYKCWRTGRGRIWQESVEGNVFAMMGMFQIFFFFFGVMKNSESVGSFSEVNHFESFDFWIMIFIFDEWFLILEAFH